MKVNLFVEVSSKCPRMSRKKFIYVLETFRNGDPVTVSGSGSGLLTYHAASLASLREALERIQRPCELDIYIQDHYARNALIWLPELSRRNFRTARGKEAKNREVLQEIQKLLTKHSFRTFAGKHEFTNWMQTELQKEDGNAGLGRMQILSSTSDD